MDRDYIFISYRRDDARGASGRLYDWLRIAFGRERVFRDVATIGIGQWRENINRALTRSSVCVAVIGPRWANPENLSRLHDGEDMVRHELVTALATPEVSLVPTLVEGAEIPVAADLPPPLQPLIEKWNVRRVTEDGWEDDIRRLIGEIAAATGLVAQPDLDTLLRDAGAAQVRVTDLEQLRHLQASQIDGLRQTVDDLTRKLAEASLAERHGLAEAFAALARGDSLAAEDAFEREYQEQSRAAAEARSTMALAARNVANLALLRDVVKAVAFYQKALAIDPEQAEAARLLGQAWLLLGNLREADIAFAQSLSAAVNANDSWGEMAAHTGRGDVLVAQGDGPGALAAFRRGLAIAEALSAREPANTHWQRDLSLSHDRLGTVLAAQGDGPGALAAFRLAQATAKALTARDPANTQWQRDLSVSQNKIGDALATQGDGPGALAAFRRGLAIAEALAARDPANIEWQRDLAVSHHKIGDVLVVQGNGSDALAAFRRGLGIAEALAARDPANTQWQRDLAVSHNKIGDFLVTQGDGPGALAAFRSGLVIMDALVARDPANAEWQRDLSIGHNKIGDVLVTQADSHGALSAFRRGLAIAEALVVRDPANTEWQRDLSVCQNKIGDVLATQGDGPGALAAFRGGLAIVEVLVARDPANTQWQRDLSITYERIGAVLRAHGDGAAALAAFRRGLAIAEALAARDPANTQWQRDLSISENKIGDVLAMQGDGPGALGAFRRGLAIAEELVKRDPANTEWQRDLIVSYVNVGEVAGDRTFSGKALNLALALQRRGVLAPRDQWMIEDLKQRAGA